MSAPVRAIASAWRRNWQMAVLVALTAAVPADALWLAPLSRPAFWAVLVALVTASVVAGYGGIPGWRRVARIAARLVCMAACVIWAVQWVIWAVRWRRRARARHKAWQAQVKTRAEEDAQEPLCPLPPDAWAYLSRERGHRP